MSATSISHVVPSQGIGHAALKGLSLFATWFLRGRARQQLRQLDELTLRDIGVTRYDAEIEANKPFWKD